MAKKALTKKDIKVSKPKSLNNNTKKDKVSKEIKNIVKDTKKTIKVKKVEPKILDKKLTKKTINSEKKELKPLEKATKSTKPLIKTKEQKNIQKKIIKEEIPKIKNKPIVEIPKKDNNLTIPTKPNLPLKNNKPVVLPKLKSKNSVTYNPEYAKSVLHKEEVEYKNQVRYNDSDLKYFKEIIIKKIEASKSELTYLQGVISKKDDSGYYDSDNKNFSIEEGGVGLEKEQLSQMARRQIQFIDNLDKALIRIENKTYGICIVTGKLIDKKRLEAVPHARLSWEAKNEANNNSNGK